MKKSTIEEIRSRFDADVERFANLETGQSATMDAPLVLELIAAGAAAVNPQAESLLDIGCGAGNYTLKLMQQLKFRRVTLIDLSQPMLDRARQRITQADPNIQITTLQGDLRELDLGQARFDVIVAAAVLHHLRADAEWSAVFTKIAAATRPAGSFWVSDFITHDVPGVRQILWQRFAEYLVQLKGPAYRDHVFEYIEQEDSPRSLVYQLELLRRAGFTHADVLHANACFAAYVGVK